MKKHFTRLKNQLKIHWRWLKNTDYLTAYEFIETVISKTKITCVICGKEFESSHPEKKHCTKFKCETIIEIIKHE